MNFEDAIKATHALETGYKPGLKAVQEAYHNKIKPRDSLLIKGSVDIDACCKATYPNDSRWDYVVGYNRKAYFIEVHPAETSQVKIVVAKLRWLKEWLGKECPQLSGYPKGNPAFCWIASGRIHLLKSSPEYRLASQCGLLPRANLHLD